MDPMHMFKGNPNNNTNINMNMNYSQLKGGNSESEPMNAMLNHMNYKPTDVYSGSNMLYMNNTVGRHMNSAMNQMHNQINLMGNTMGGGMNTGMVSGMGMMNNTINTNMKQQKSVFNVNNEINDRSMNKNLLGGMNTNDKMKFSNFGMNKFNNSENLQMKTDEYNKFTNINQENVLMNNTQRKLNFLNKDAPSMKTNVGANMGTNMGTNMDNVMDNTIANNMGTTMNNNMGTTMTNNMGNTMTNNMGNTMTNNMGTTMTNNMGNLMDNLMSNNRGSNLNMHTTSGKIKPYSSNIMSHNVINTSNNIMSRLNKNVNVFENTRGDNPMKENMYDKMFQNTLNNNTTIGKVNMGTTNEPNNAMHGIKSNINTFMQGITGINKPNTIPNKGVGVNMYTDTIMNSLNVKTRDGKLNLYDGGANKLKETDENTMMNNNHMKPTVPLNTFMANQTTNNMNTVMTDHQFGSIGRIGTLNKTPTLGAPGMSTAMGNMQNPMDNLTQMNNVNMNNVHMVGMNPLGNAGGIADPLMRNMTNTSNNAVPNNFGKNLLVNNNSNINNISNDKLMNKFNIANVNKGIGISSVGGMPKNTMSNMGGIQNIIMNNMGGMTNPTMNNMTGINNEKGGSNMFQKPATSFLNIKTNPTKTDTALQNGDRGVGGAFDFLQNNKRSNGINKITEINVNSVNNDVNTSINPLNQMSMMNRNMNILNSNVDNVANAGNVANMGNMDGMNNMNMHANQSGMNTLGMNQRGFNQIRMNMIDMNPSGMNYMAAGVAPGVNGTIGMNSGTEQEGVVGMLRLKQNEPEAKPVDVMDYRKERLLNQQPDFQMNEKPQQDKMSIDNYANLLKQLCTPVKNRSETTNIETFNENMFNFDNNENGEGINNEENTQTTNMFKNEASYADGLNANVTNKSTNRTNFNEEQMFLHNRNEMNMNEFRNTGTTNTRTANKEGNIYELKKLNLFAKTEKKDNEQEQDTENKSKKIKKSKTKVFFYMNPKYILEPLKRKIYEKMSFYIENLISDIKSIENKDRSKILEELHATSWFFQVFDFDAISKLLNVFNKYLIYSDSLIIPDILIANKLEVEEANNALLNGMAVAAMDGNNTGISASHEALKNASHLSEQEQLMMMLKNNDISNVRADDFVKTFNFYFKKSDKLDMLNQKMHDYESNIIENVDKLNYMKELCRNLQSQIHLKKKTFLLLLEKAKLKNFTYKNEHLQTVLNIDKNAKPENTFGLNNEYYDMFKKINEGLIILKGYSHIMVTYPNYVNEVLSSESVRLYASTNSSDEEKIKKKVQILDDSDEVGDSNSVNVSATAKTKNKRKLEEQNKNDADDDIFSLHDSLNEVEKDEAKDLTDLSKSKKRKTIKEIKHMHKQMDNNEEWVDEFLDDF